jgi:AraC-like DNA-binding protein
LLSALSFLVVYDNAMEQKLWVYFLIPISFSSSFFFWLFAKSVFDDKLVIHVKYLFYFFLVGSIMLFSHLQHAHHLFFDPELVDIGLNFMVKAIPALTSIFFVVLAVLESQKKPEKDLINSRRTFRCYFIPITAVLLVLTITGKLSITGLSKIPPSIDLFHKVIILCIILPFIFLRLQLKRGFFLSTSDEIDDEIPPAISEGFISDLENFMVTKRVYIEEDVSLKTIASSLKVPEYKVRKIINSKLGYRNFNEFINSYRINEACRVLEDKSNQDLTILEIAYSIGYKSISPFNRAFKELKGQTPTQYRKTIIDT